MKNTHAVALAVAILTSAAPATAQVFGQFTGAEPLAMNGRMFGGYVQTSANTVGLMAQLRLSFYPGVDFGFHGGFSREELTRSNITTVRLGTDFKIGVVKPSDARPVSISLGGALDVETGDHFNILTLGPTMIASRTFKAGSTGSFTPYARLGLAFANINVRSTNDTDLSAPVRIGSEFRIGPTLGIAAELQLQLADSFNDDLGFAAGVNLPF